MKCEYERTKNEYICLKCSLPECVMVAPKKKEVKKLDTIKFLLDPIIRDKNGIDVGTPQMPTRAHEHDAGLDIYSPRHLHIYPQGSVAVDTGIHVLIPKGYAGLVVNRSGLNINHGIVCPPGTIDAGYTGSLVVKLYNHSDAAYDVHVGDRIAQLLIVPIETPAPVQVYDLPETERAGNGFGSTGK